MQTKAKTRLRNPLVKNTVGKLYDELNEAAKARLRSGLLDTGVSLRTIYYDQTVPIGKIPVERFMYYRIWFGERLKFPKAAGEAPARRRRQRAAEEIIYKAFNHPNAHGPKDPPTQKGTAYILNVVRQMQRSIAEIENLLEKE